RRMIARSIAAAAAKPPRLTGPAIERLLATLEAGRTATLAGVQCTTNGAIWTFRPAPPRRSG
ncbi:MAG: tRNA lysidine(34) synthetase TilS, partial [Sphingomonadaceae bacterium]|nr:tRNA lysidine(34) synthetase TilS [Sphingomonadaceae bacterium]